MCGVLSESVCARGDPRIVIFLVDRIDLGPAGKVHIVVRPFKAYHGE